MRLWACAHRGPRGFCIMRSLDSPRCGVRIGGCDRRTNQEIASTSPKRLGGCLACLGVDARPVAVKAEHQPDCQAHLDYHWSIFSHPKSKLRMDLTRFDYRIPLGNDMSFICYDSSSNTSQQSYHYLCCSFAHNALTIS